MLADLLHHVRAELDSAQLRRTIAIYSANLHDESLAPSIQTMCAKLLLNLIDRIIKLPDSKDGIAFRMPG
jgi:transformation/transcription domain-associated protein